MAKKYWELSEFAEFARLFLPKAGGTAQIVCLRIRPYTGMSCAASVSVEERHAEGLVWVQPFMWLPELEIDNLNCLPRLREVEMRGAYAIVPGECTAGHRIGKLGTLEWKRRGLRG